MGNFRDGDIIGFISSEPDRELLFPDIHYENLVDFGIHQWLLITANIHPPFRSYELMLGFPFEAPLDAVAIPNDNFESTIIALLLKATSLDLISERRDAEDIDQIKFDVSTIINTLVDLIPDISDLWEYCAVLTSSPDQGGLLRVIAFSRDFPRGLRQELSNIIIEPGQPLAGWAYEQSYPIIIQRATEDDDPRLAFQNLEKATAAIAIPTHAQKSRNGVLYVGTRFEIPQGKNAFSEAEIRVLMILADIIGEVIERNRIRRKSELLSLETINKTPITYQTWSTLESSIKHTLSQVTKLETDPSAQANLHLTIVRIEAVEKLRLRSPSISTWITNHILETTRDFFLFNEFGDPNFYLYDFHFPNKFACLLPHLVITDKEDRKLRNMLRELLSSLKLSFSFNDHVQINTNVWSMPFRYIGLIKRMKQFSETNQAIEYVAREIVSEVEDALAVIPYIERGHMHERENAYSDALEQYLTAHLLAPKNRYIIRHIAKTYSAVGDYSNSVNWWEKLIDKKHPRHYCRYAQAQALLNQIENACESYQIAHNLDLGNPNILLEWGDLLFNQGEFDDAIHKYEKALKLEQFERDTLWLRIAEARLISGDKSSALSCVKLVLNRKPDNREARRLMLRIKSR
jgi:tetratricopeptide (TPR) repeat protein